MTTLISQIARAARQNAKLASANARPARRQAAAQRLAASVMVFVTGCSACALSTASAQPVVWDDRGSTAGPSARRYMPMVFDTHRRVMLLFGGSVGIPDLANGETWTYDGTTWTQLLISGPSARWVHAMAYDPVRRKAVLFGGVPGNTSETWEWDSDSGLWSNTHRVGPSERRVAAMTYDPLRHEVILFGGEGPGVFLNDTWAWNGSTWTQKAVGGPAPSPRSDPGMTFDAARGVVLLLGGLLQGPTPDTPGIDNLTWTWNGTAWSQQHPAHSPPASHGHRLANDPDRGRVVAFGSDVQRVWEWDGADWSQGPVQNPAPGSDAAMEYDLQRHRVVFFGGGLPTLLRNTWELVPCGLVLSQPVPARTCPGGTAQFSITAIGHGTLSYQWRKDGSPIDPVNVPSASSSTLVVGSAGPSDAGSYDCVVSGDCGSATSRSATLRVCPADFNCNGEINPDDLGDYITCFFTEPPCPTADFNADGDINPDDLGDYITTFFGPAC